MASEKDIEEIKREIAEVVNDPDLVIVHDWIFNVPNPKTLTWKDIKIKT